MTFRKKFAAQAGCEEEDVMRYALIECVIPWKRPLYRLASTLAPAHFELDRDTVSDALCACSLDEVKHSVEMLHFRSRGTKVFWRDMLGLRISGRRLMRLASRTFRDSQSQIGALRDEK